MRGFASYLVAGVLVVTAMDFIAPPVGLGLALGAWPVVDQGQLIQSVIRTHKSDRLDGPSRVGSQQAPKKSPKMLVGCDPVFSPLSASAKANFAGRCVA